MEPVHVPDPRRERGESLVEVLVALAIMLLIMVSVLQLFTMALLTFHATNAQAEMTTKAEAVVEVIRLVRSTGASGASGILPLASDTRSLPTRAGEAGFSFWGPTGFAVVEEDPPYRISYQVEDLVTEWQVTVFVEPRRDGDGLYLTSSAQRKGVRYAARIPK